MRSEKEMYDLILQTAIDDERIIAVTISGSRVNKNAPKDIFQDFDICYVVDNIDSFVSDEKWLRRFGEPLICGEPLIPLGHRFYLMQFTDGNRIDLNIYPKELAHNCVKSSLSAVLLDKNNIFPQIDNASDTDFHIKKPNELEFSQTCFAFWCTCPYVAKGLWREQALFALGAIEKTLRPCLMKMLDWYVGVNNNFSVTTGKHYKYINRYLEQDIWETLISTYTNADIESIWNSMFTMSSLFGKIATSVADSLSFKYNKLDEDNVVNFIKHINNLPKDATAIF